MNYWVFIAVFAAAAAIFSMINILLSRMAINKKMVWFAFVVLFPLVGPMIYIWKRNTLV